MLPVTQGPPLSFVPPIIRVPESCIFLPLADCARVVETYHSRQIRGAPGADSVWSIHSATSQAEMMGALQSRDPAALFDQLNRAHYTHTMTGYDQNGRQTAGFDAQPGHLNWLATMIYTTLIRLGSATGVLRVFNPEQPGNFPWLAEDQTATILPALARVLPIGRKFPVAAKGEAGIATPMGLLGHRHAIGLGYLREIKDVLEANPGRYTRIVEIGGGLGRTAFHVARDMGLAVTILDLPVVGVTQYAFLRVNGVKVDLWPESAAAPKPGNVSLINAFSAHDPADYTGALFVNFDSFVEMGRDAQESYFDLITAAGCDLLSINHEADKVMTGAGHRQQWDLARLTARGFDASPRQIFWERDGYIRQFFRNRNGIQGAALPQRSLWQRLTR